ncbi:MAG: sigma-70 family RNA polymerase sigma factor, partial [Ferruginibacter sp.]
AYAYLYKFSYPVVERYILQNSGSVADARDIFQNALIVIHNKAHENKLEISSSFKTYLYSICRNLWLKELREKRKSNFIIAEEIDESAEEKIIESDTQNNFLQKLSRAFSKMTGHCKMLIISMFYKKNSIAVVAAENGYKNVHTAQNQKYKCLEQARKEFKK